MASVTKFPSSNQAAGSPFNGSWTNPNNAHADDGVYATAAPGKNQEYASVWNVAFTTSDVPDNATVTSVTVEVQWKVSTTSSVATLRSTAFADSVQATAVSASPGVNDTAEPTTDTVRTYTATPTLAELRDLWIRVQAMRGNTNTAFTGSLDYLKVTVNYSVPVDTTATPGVASLSTSVLAPSVTTSSNQLATIGLATLATSPKVPAVSTTAHQTATIGVASLILSPQTPTVTATDPKTVVIGVSALSTSPKTPTVTASDHQSATPGVVSLSTATFAPTIGVTDQQNAVPGVTSLVLSLLAPSVVVSDHKAATPDTTALEYVGFAPDIAVSQHQTAVPGPLGLTIEAFAPDAISSSAAGVEIGTAELALTASRPTVTVSSWGAGPWIKEGTIHEGYPPKNH